MIKPDTLGKTVDFDQRTEVRVDRFHLVVEVRCRTCHQVARRDYFRVRYRFISLDGKRVWDLDLVAVYN